MAAVLFDLYGTLINICTDEHSLCFWKSFTKTVKRYTTLAPDALAKSFQEICKNFESKVEEIEILDVFQSLFTISREQAIEVARIFRKKSTKYIHLYPGVRQLLKSLKSKGYSLYVLSNAQEAFTLDEIKKLKIISFFDGIAISSKYGVKKPNLDFFKRAIEAFHIKDEIWMIGNDYECDIVPAKKLGLKTIFIESNLTPKNSIEDKMRGFHKEEILRRITEE